MLLVICLAELLERYGNYLIAALLPLFLNEHERLAPAVALRLAGYYLALGYAGGVIGGFVADRFLGYRLATRLGTVLFGLGAALLTSSRPGTLYPALALLVLGSSCFKPALSAWLGSLYAAGDVRQSAGFAWLYFAANIGAVVAPFVGGALRTRYSWPLAFATTTLAFGLCLVVVLVGQIGAPAPRDQRPSAPLRTEGPDGHPDRVSDGHPDNGPDGHPHGGSDGRPDAAPGRTRWRTLLVLLLLLILFALAYGQSGGAMLFFARDRVDRRLLGWVIPPDFFASVPAALVLILTALQQALWRALARRHGVPRPGTAMTIGMVSSSVAFALLAAVAATHGAGTPCPLIGALWIVATLTLLTVGEVLVIPVGMALVAQSAPPHKGALAQGLLSAALAIGLALAGEAGRFIAPWGAARFFAAVAVLPLLGALLLVAGGAPRPTAEAS